MIDAATAPAPEATIPFGRWILNQADRHDHIGALAKAARLDRGFPKDGSFEAVSDRLSLLGADPDMHVALEDAELHWSAY